MRRLLIIYIFPCVFFFLCQMPVTYCQNSGIDSLLTLIKTDKPDTNTLIHLNKLSAEYGKIDSFDNTILYANLALKLCNTILIGTKDPKITTTAKKEEALSYNNLGTSYYFQGNYSLALKNYFASLKIYETIGNKKHVASAFIKIGNVYYYQGNYPEALKNYLNSLKINETIHNKLGVADCYNNIGNVYSDQGNYPEALNNAYSCLKLMKEMDNKAGIATSYNNIGNVYQYQNNYSEALKNFQISMKIREALGDKSGIADLYNNIGNVYYRQGNFSEALKNNFSSLKIREEIDSKIGISQSLFSVGEVLSKQKKYIKAREYLNQAKVVAGEIGYKECSKNIFGALAELDSARGDFKGAYENHKLYILYRDSLDNEETRKKTIQSQMTFDFEKKEAIAEAEHKKELQNQELLAEERSRKQNIIILFVGGGLLLVIIFAILIFRSLRITRKQKKLIEMQKHLVEQQKLEVEHQKLKVEEHQKEIIDSITYARRIQVALLPSERYIHNSLKRLIKK